MEKPPTSSKTVETPDVSSNPVASGSPNAPGGSNVSVTVPPGPYSDSSLDKLSENLLLGFKTMKESFENFGHTMVETISDKLDNHHYYYDDDEMMEQEDEQGHEDEKKKVNICNLKMLNLLQSLKQILPFGRQWNLEIEQWILDSKTYRKMLLKVPSQ